MPGPDETVWCMNTTIERQPDGTWRGWVDPLDASGPERIRVEVSGETADDLRVALFAAIARIEFEHGPEVAEEWQRAHARPFLARQVPAREWPPSSGIHRGLDFEPLAPG